MHIETEHLERGRVKVRGGDRRDGSVSSGPKSDEWILNPRTHMADSTHSTDSDLHVHTQTERQTDICLKEYGGEGDIQNL